MACFIAEHNLSFNIASHLNKLICAVCPDSKIAEQLSISRTKARAIIVIVTGQTAEKHIIEMLQNNCFALLVDESTDKSTIKHLALVARIVKLDFSVEDRFLTLIPIVDGTATALYGKIVEYFVEKNIPYKSNMIGFASDGANVMFGDKHSLVTLFKNDIPHIFTMKGICHSFNLCASYACEKLPRGVEDFCRDVYNHVQNSPKRIGDFKTFQAFTNIKPHKLLHPSHTRWLSLIEVVNRFLEQLPAIKLYFQAAVHINMDADMPAAPTPTTRSAVNGPRQAAAPVAAPRTTTPTVPRSGTAALPSTPTLVADPQRRRCPLCRRPHRLPQCVIFKGLPPQQRQLVVQAHGHCLNCLTPVHQTHECTSGNLCQICMRPHHTMLHRAPGNDTSQPPAGRNRGAVQRPPLRRDARPRRTIGPSSSCARRPHNGASTRRQQQRPRPRRTSGLSSVVATLQQLQRILG
ncbi:uncharacterized protein LOC120781553 [Bactrocera tryoni]|uniref:uncharacterized protein LOC120781553 n=1 Tax=Bactrocera tryoni TaxID=59916 RepID=UPI001A9766AD|nr:uncharacterized protein LOC120781553 [Bactrocera tryoni]